MYNNLSILEHPLRNVDPVKEINPEIPEALPHEKVYSIQVGYKLFRLSGLSLSSDAPSYFVKYFSQDDNEDKVLFIDRSPVIFEKIYNHLQGYTINVEGDYEFVHLWSDAFYFGLKKLQTILTEQDIFANIGNQSFKISRSLFVNSGNYPNYFTVNYDGLLSDNLKVYENKKMLRPPPQRPATVANRSPALFADLLELLRGNNLIVKNDEHRLLLMRECKYYRFLELEQRILKHRIINNPFMENKQEIILNLNDLQRKGVVNDSALPTPLETPIQYVRPYIINEPKRNLIFQLDSNGDIFNKNYSEVKLIVNKTLNITTIQISNKLCQKYISVFQDYSEDFLIEDIDTNTPTITCIAGFADCKAVINGMRMKKSWIHDLIGKPESEDDANAKKRKLNDTSAVQGDIIEIKLTNSLWRMLMIGHRSRLHAVSIEGLTDHSSFIQENIEFL